MNEVQKNYFKAKADCELRSKLAEKELRDFRIQNGIKENSRDIRVRDMMDVLDKKYKRDELMIALIKAERNLIEWGRSVFQKHPRFKEIKDMFTFKCTKSPLIHQQLVSKLSNMDLILS